VRWLDNVGERWKLFNYPLRQVLCREVLLEKSGVLDMGRTFGVLADGVEDDQWAISWLNGGLAGIW
jgi:hypothetical protein